MLFTLGGSMFSFIAMIEPPSVASHEIFSDEASTGNHCLELAERQLAREVLHPAVRRHHEPLRSYDGEGLADPGGDDLRRLGLARAQVEDAEDDRLVGHLAYDLWIEVGLRGLER